MTVKPVTVAAVDLGASSGRIMVGRLGPDTLDVAEVERFDNIPVRAGGTLHWDILRIYAGVLDGLRAAGRHAGHIASIGVDSWAVDFGLLDSDGRLLGNPVHYRDGRTDGVAATVTAEVSAGGAVPAHRRAVPAVQHHVPTRRRGRHRPARRGVARCC